MAAVDEKVKQIIVEQLGVEESEVAQSASFVDDLGADSLDTVELVMAFEEAFEIEIPDEDAEKIREAMPALLTGGSVTFTSERIAQIEQALSLVLEEIPDIAYEVTWSVDKKAAAAVIKAGGEAGALVLEARSPDGALGVRA